MPTGRPVLALGDVERPVYPRSAVKALQALPLVESGAADRYGLGDEELALACASHSAASRPCRDREPDAGARRARCGRAANAARTGRSISRRRRRWRARRNAGALHNNCSGKHAGFLCVACALGADRGHYIEPEHPVQRAVKATLESLTGAALSQDVCARRRLLGADLGDAAVGAGPRLCPLRYRRRPHAGPRQGGGALRAACAAHPWHVAGTGRFCTEIMQRLGERAFVKTGAEGVYCAALPEQGLGIAVKCDDGAGRAAEVMLAAMLVRFLPEGIDTLALEQYVRPTLRNWNGIAVGSLRPAAVLTG